MKIALWLVTFLLIISGLMLGQERRVFIKATRICLECIGIG